MHSSSPSPSTSSSLPPSLPASLPPSILREKLLEARVRELEKKIASCGKEAEEGKSTDRK
jgi:hypothetical protein